MSKTKWIRICIILAISLVVAIAFFAMKTYQGHRNIKMVDSYIEQKHLSDDIKSENTI